MNITKKICAVVVCMAMVVGVLLAQRYTSLDTEREEVFAHNDSLVIWYTDDALTDYLNAMAVEYHETYGARVIPKLQSGSEYVESVYKASVEKDGAPDLYIITNDSLEKAYLSGCAAVIADEKEDVSTSNFSQVAIDSVTYKNNKVAYPFFFETCALIYNKTYLQDYAYSKIEAEDKEAAEAAGETVSEESSSSSENKDSTEASTEASTEEASTEEEDLPLSEKLDAETFARVNDRVAELIPATFDDLLAFAEEYDAPADLESIFKWDVRDIFYNYYFVGNYADVGGSCGDNPDIISIYNINSVSAMQLYQNLNQFFSFEYANMTYQDVIQEFSEGKILYTTATTDIIATLNEKAESGDFAYEYGVAPIPDLNADKPSKNLSVTDCIVINGYSDKRDQAESFARFLTIAHAGELYEKTGKLAANINAQYENEDLNVFLDEYADSVPMPKMMATSNYWLKLETAFADVWGGAQVSPTLKNLSEEIKQQVSGILVEEEYIEEDKEEESIEYLDEEQLRQEALEEATEE